MVSIPIRYKHLVEERDRHGKLRFYVRIGQGRRRRLREAPGTEAFRAEYDKALAWLDAGAPVPDDGRPKIRRIMPGSFRAASIDYFASADFLTLAPETQKARRRLFEAMWDERIDRDSPDPIMADCPLTVMQTKHVALLRDRKVSAPEQANHRVKTLRAFFRWALPAKGLTADPSATVKLFRRASTGHHTWTDVEIGQFLDRHGKGTQARLAMALAFYTGMRISDLARVGPQHVRDGRLTLTVHKNRNRKPVVLDIPVHPNLTRIIGESEIGHLAYLVTAHGKPFSDKGMGNKFKDWCVAAALPHCTAHGIRKGSATIAAEGDAGEQSLMALYGWNDPKQAAHYTKKARKKRLADLGMAALSTNRIPHFGGDIPASEGKAPKKVRKDNVR